MTMQPVPNPPQSNAALAVSPDEITRAYDIEPGLVRDTLELERIVALYSPAALSKLPSALQTAVMSRGMKLIREAMTEKLVKFVFMPMQGSKLGFRTDKDKDGGYPWEVVRDAAIEAMMRGLRPIGNEFNIIGGNCYTTKEGIERKLADFPGLTNLDLTPGVPTVKDSAALVPFEATWRLNGKPDELRCLQFPPDKDGVVIDTRIPVRVNAGQIVDAIIGKARRKMLGKIWERITGIREDVGDAIDTVGEAVKEDRKAQGSDAAADELINKHKGKVAAKKNTDPAADSSGNPEPGANG